MYMHYFGTMVAANHSLRASATFLPIRQYNRASLQPCTSLMRNRGDVAKTQRTLDAMRMSAPACAFNNVRVLSRSIEKIYDDAFRPIGLSASQVALLWTVLMVQPVAVKVIARVAKADQTTVSRTVARAQELGLLNIKRDGHDQRKKIIGLSPLGSAKLAKAFPLWKKAQKSIGSMFNPGTLQQLTLSVRKHAPAPLNKAASGYA
jgi:DNA-binding MarR family transcriptional regulator